MPEDPRVEKAVEIFNDSKRLYDWKTNRLDSREALAPYLDEEDLDEMIDELRVSIESFQVADPLVELVLGLRQDGFDVIANSNNIKEFSDAWPEYEISKICNGVILSSDSHAMKDDPENFYGRYLADNHLVSANCLLVDNSKANCKAFQNWGGKTAFYKNPQQIRDHLKTFLF